MLLIARLIFIILTIATFLGTSIKFEKDRYGDPKPLFKPSLKTALTAIPVVLFLLLNFLTVIPANTVGIQYSPFTGVKTETLGEGLKVKGFFDQIYQLDTKVQSKELTDVSGQTKDSQFIKMDLDIKYQVIPSKAYEVFRQYKTLKNIDETLIAPVTQRAIESVTTKYNVMEVLGEKRNQIYAEIEKELQVRFEESGILFRSITFVDTDGGSEIEAAIRAEAVAKKAVETAEQDRLKAEIKAQERVVEAQANLDKARIEAEQRIVEATAQAEANDLLDKSLSADVLNKMWIEKWNGTLPEVVSDGNMIYGLNN